MKNDSGSTTASVTSTLYACNHCSEKSDGRRPTKRFSGGRCSNQDDGRLVQWMVRGTDDGLGRHCGCFGGFVLSHMESVSPKTVVTRIFVTQTWSRFGKLKKENKDVIRFQEETRFCCKYFSWFNDARKTKPIVIFWWWWCQSREIKCGAL